MRVIGSALRSFGKFWHEFIIGDDWTVAAAVTAAITGTWALSRAGITAWWLLPIVVAVSVGVSIWRLERRVP